MVRPLRSASTLSLCLLLLITCPSPSIPLLNCPPSTKWGPGPPSSCAQPSDPNRRPPSALEQWFTREMFNDLFPNANLGWGPHPCLPYSYESFVIAARYFPRFGTESPSGNGLSPEANTRRDVAAFLAHAIQETGMNDLSVYQSGLNQRDADACFYRGALFNWFEGGPSSAFLDPQSPGFRPSDGDKCLSNGRYCSPSLFFPCANGTSGEYLNSCYFGRGAIQISYNYNYAQFQAWLRTQGIQVDLLTQPNLVVTNTDPPVALLASLWFYMTPQPPKPAMHDIVLGQWHAGPENEAAGYSGPIFGPTSLIINNECTGEDPNPPGGGGENRRIRAFKWLCDFFGVPAGKQETLSCKNMPRRFDQLAQNKSWQPDWATTWQEAPCNCTPAGYEGVVPYFQPGFYPSEFVGQNEANRVRCQSLVYEYPAAFGMDPNTSVCLKHRPGVEEKEEKVPREQRRTTTAMATMARKNSQSITPGGKVATSLPEMRLRGVANYLRPDPKVLANG